MLTGIAWSVASPPGSSPDDDFHAASIWCPDPVETSGCELVRDASGKVTGVLVPQSVATPAGCYAFHPEESGAACLQSLRDDQLVAVTWFNQGLYPGPYYRVLHLLVGNEPVASLVGMRIFNAALSVIVLGGLLWTAQLRDRRTLSLAWFASAIPLGMFVTASINPSSWAFTGVTGTWLGLTILLNGERRASGRTIATISLTVVAALMAASARSDAGFYLVLVAGVVGLLQWGRLRQLGWWLLLLVVPVILGCLSFFSSSQTNVVQGSWNAHPERSPMGILQFNLTELTALVSGVFGGGWGLGWLDIKIPSVTTNVGLMIAAGLIFLGLNHARPVKVLAFLAVLGAVLLIPLLLLQVSHNVMGENIQPRYILPLIPILIGVALFPNGHRHPVDIGRVPSYLLAALLPITHSVALFAVIRRHVTGLDRGGANLNNDIEWWWPNLPSPMIVWAVGSAAFGIVCLAALALGWPRLRPSQPVVPDPDTNPS